MVWGFFAECAGVERGSIIVDEFGECRHFEVLSDCVDESFGGEGQSGGEDMVHDVRVVLAQFWGNPLIM